MSLPVTAVYNELRSSCVVEGAVYGNFSDGCVRELIISTGDRLTLWRVVEGLPLQYVTCLTFPGRIHDMAVYRPVGGLCDVLMVSFRQGLLSIFEFDKFTNSFKTVSVFSTQPVEEAKISKLRVCKRTGSSAAVQANPAVLSIVGLAGSQFSGTSTDLEIPKSLGFSVLEDFVFSDDLGYGEEVVLCCLGQVRAHCWVGRSTTAKASGAIKIFSLSMDGRVNQLWVVENLPHGVFGILSLGSSHSGFLAVSPDSVTYCCEFGESWALKVNEAEWELAESNRLLPVRSKIDWVAEEHPDDMVTEELTESRQISLDGCGYGLAADDVVSFSLMDGSFLFCHLIRNPLGEVTGMIWEDAIKEKSTSSQVIIGIPGDMEISRQLFLGSRLGDSVMYKLATSSVALPTHLASKVFSYCDETLEDKIFPVLTPTDANDALLLEMYGSLEVPGSLQTWSVDSEIDRFVGFGMIRNASSGDDGIMYLCCGGGREGAVVAIPAGGFLPTEEIVACNLPKSLDGEIIAAVLIKDSESATTHLLVSSATHSLLISILSGIKAIGVPVNKPFLAGCQLGSGALLVNKDGISLVDLTGEHREIYKFSEKAVQVSLEISRSIVYAGVRGEDGNTAVFEILENLEIRHIPVNLPAISCVGMGALGDDILLLIVVKGSLWMGRLVIEGIVDLTCLGLVGVLPPILTAMGADDPSDLHVILASAASTDFAARPVEAHPGALVLAERCQVLGLGARMVGKVACIFVAVEGRPIAVYRGFAISDSQSPAYINHRFSLDTACLLASSAPPLVGSALPTPFLHAFPEMGVCAGGMCFIGNKRNEIIGYQTKSDEVSPGLILPIKTGFCEKGVIVINKRRLRVLSFSEFSQELVEDAAPALTWDLANGGFAISRFLGVPMLSSVNTSNRCLAVAVATPEEDLVMAGATVAMSTEEDDSGMPGQDWMDQGDIVQATPQQVTSDSAIPRTRLRFEVRLLSLADMRTILGSVVLEADEHVTGLGWQNDLLFVGTSIQSTEDSAGKGRILVIKKGGESGAELLHASERKTGVSTLRIFNDMIAASLGYKFMLYQWESENNKLRGVGMVDVALHTTCVASAKNYIVAGDLLRGVQFHQYKEDEGMRSIMFLAKSTPFIPITVISIDCLSSNSADKIPSGLGIVAADDRGNIHLLSFSLEMGVILRQCMPYGLSSSVRSFTNYDQGGLLAALSNGTISRLSLLPPGDFHLATALSALLIAFLPFPGGANPRISRSAIGPEFKRQINTVLLSGGEGIEGGRILKSFLYLGVVLQAEIAERLGVGLDVLCEKIAAWCA